MRTDATVYMKHFYDSPFTGDIMQEEIRDKKVAKVIKSMGDKYLLAVPVQKLTKGETK
jgi:hypothetical protein